MLFSPGRQVLVEPYWRRDSIENISNAKRRRIHEYLSFRAAVKTDAGTAAAAHTGESKVRVARQPPRTQKAVKSYVRTVLVSELAIMHQMKPTGPRTPFIRSDRMNGALRRMAERWLVPWGCEEAVELAGVGAGGDDAEACDLTLVVDAESGEQIHGRVCRNEIIEIAHVALVP